MMDSRASHQSPHGHSAALPLFASLAVAASVWGAGAFGLIPHRDATGPGWNLTDSHMPRGDEPTEEELLQRAIAEHSAAFPVAASPGVPEESPDAAIQRAVDEHGASIEGLSAGF